MRKIWNYIKWLWYGFEIWLSYDESIPDQRRMEKQRQEWRAKREALKIK